ncbi:MAG: G2-specific serine/threonine protein kinase, partial [Pleopsidium flavum]
MALPTRASRWDQVDAYERVHSIGEGGQGSCVLFRRSRDKKLMVRKTITRPKLSQGIPLEIRILRDILPTHRRIANLYHAFTFELHTELYLEYCDAGDLHDLIDEYAFHNTTIPESFLWHVFIQLAEALAFIHYGWSIEDTQSCTTGSRPAWNRVIHRDIKPANIFMIFRTRHRFQTSYPDIKLGDFGLAAVTTDASHTADSYCGTYAWQPPELPEATAKGDVWSLGAIVHALAHQGSPPLADIPPFWPRTRTHEERWDMHPDAREPQLINDTYSAALERWMLKTFRRDPARRVSSMELVEEMAPDGRRRMAREWWPLKRW